MCALECYIYFLQKDRDKKRDKIIPRHRWITLFEEILYGSSFLLRTVIYFSINTRRCLVPRPRQARVDYRDVRGSGGCPPPPPSSLSSSGLRGLVLHLVDSTRRGATHPDARKREAPLSQRHDHRRGHNAGVRNTEWPDTFSFVPSSGSGGVWGEIRTRQSVRHCGTLPQTGFPQRLAAGS